MRKIGIKNLSIKEITKKYIDDGYDQYDLSDEYKYCQPHISRIVNNKVSSFEDKLFTIHNQMIVNITPSNCEPIQAKILRAKRTRLHSTKINMKIAGRIRQMYFSGNYTQIDLSIIFNLNQSSISRIIHGLKWKRIR